jgi:site-specific recombinase XerD
MENRIQLPYFDDFLLNLQTKNLSEETVYNYERDLKTFEDFLNEINTPFDKVDKKIILHYKAYLTSRDRKTPKLAPGKKRLASYSINRMLSALRSYLKFLTNIDYPVPVPPNAIELMKTEKKLSKVGEFEEILKLLDAPLKFEKNKNVAIRNKAILETLFSTGARISELVNIKLTDIDNNGRIFIKGKGKKERFVYLTPRAQKYLKEYLKIRENSDSPYLFIPFKGKNVNLKSKKISTNYLEDRIKKYRELLGLNIPITPHGFRRAFATYLAEKGASVAAIQILLGHESLDTTTRYVRASQRFAEEIFKKYHPLKD